MKHNFNPQATWITLSNISRTTVNGHFLCVWQGKDGWYCKVENAKNETVHGVFDADGQQGFNTKEEAKLMAELFCKNKIAYCPDCGVIRFAAVYTGESEAEQSDIDKQLTEMEAHGYKISVGSSEYVRSGFGDHMDGCGFVNGGKLFI